jgi:hypothetical protein
MSATPTVWRDRFRRILVVAIGAVFLMLPAFYNGFPFLYSDTATYLSSGFELETPFDRPITYGLFIALTSLWGTSVWLVVFAQCVLTSWLCHRMMSATGRPAKDVYFLVVMGLLTALTTVGWVACQLMPDIFTATMLLSAVLLLSNSEQGWRRITLYAVYLLSCAMHLSHVSLGLVILVPVLLVALLFRKSIGSALHIKANLVLLGLTGASVLTMGSAMAKSRNVFFMGALAEHGLLKAYLDDHCPADLRVCAQKDSLPAHAYDFIWGPESTVERIGGWEVANKEFSRIIPETFSDPKYLGLHVSAAAEATVDQLFLFSIGDGWGRFGEGTNVRERTLLYFPSSSSAYGTSRQANGTLRFTRTLNRWLPLILLIVSIAIVVRITITRQGKNRSTIIAILILCIVANAFVCGTFANSVDRLGAKTIWLLPAALFVLEPARRVTASVRGS